MVDGPAARSPVLLRYALVPPAKRSDRPPLLVLLHGYGSHERAMLRMVPPLDPRCCTISVRGPLQVRYGRYAWSPVIFAREGPADDAAAIRDSLRRLRQSVDAAVEAHGLDARRVFVAGFSQGAAVALAYGLAEETPAAGVVALSGALPAGAALGSARGLAAFIGHGARDDVVPLGVARSLRDRLVEAGADVTYREYPAGHEVTARERADAGGWLADRLAALGEPRL